MPPPSRTGVPLTLDPEGATGTGVAGPSEPEEAESESAFGPEPNKVRPPKSRREAVGALIGRLVTAIRDGDEQVVESAVLALSQRSRWLAPLAMVVGAFAMLFQGVKLLFTNWRLTLVQILPAMWIWCAMLDLKAHVLHGKEFHIFRGPWLIPVVLAVAAITAGSFFLNAVFAFAIAKPGAPEIRPAFAKARTHLRTIFTWGFGVGLALGFATVVADRWGLGWFGLSLGIVVAVMMLAYVSVPARLVGVKSERSSRDKLAATAIGGAIGAMVCSPPYVLGRVALLMLGSHTFRYLAIILLVVAIVLQTGATSAVKAIKMSAKLVTGHTADAAGSAADPERPATSTSTSTASATSMSTATAAAAGDSAFGAHGASPGAAAAPMDGV
jgi:hypothetical protein